MIATLNEFIRFLKISKGSCAEIRTPLIIAKRVGEISDDNGLLDRTIKVSKMIQGMINYREKLSK